jgi:hypothetical protein
LERRGAALKVRKEKSVESRTVLTSSEGGAAVCTCPHAARLNESAAPANELDIDFNMVALP